MKTTNALIGIAAAATAGVVIGMLIAPEKGSDLQKKIKLGAQNWLAEISKLIQIEKGLLAQGKEEAEKTLHRLGNQSTSV